MLPEAVSSDVIKKGIGKLSLIPFCENECDLTLLH